MPGGKFVYGFFSSREGPLDLLWYELEDHCNNNRLIQKMSKEE